MVAKNRASAAVLQVPDQQLQRLPAVPFVDIQLEHRAQSRRRRRARVTVEGNGVEHVAERSLPQLELEMLLGHHLPRFHRKLALEFRFGKRLSPRPGVTQLLREFGTPCLIHQPKFHLFDRWIERGLTQVLLDEGIGGIAFCPLAQGLLTSRYLGGIPADSRAGHDPRFLKPEHITEEKLGKIRQLDALAKQRGQSLAQMALAWVLHNPAITSALIGASKVSQIEENVAGLKNLAFTAAELAEIDRVVGAGYKDAV